MTDIEGFITRLGLPILELLGIGYFVWKVAWPWMTKQVERLNQIAETSIKAMMDTSNALSALSKEIKDQSTPELTSAVRLLSEMLQQHDANVRRDFDEVKRKLDARVDR